jgi:hypothetical protein
MEEPSHKAGSATAELLTTSGMVMFLGIGITRSCSACVCHLDAESN